MKRGKHTKLIIMEISRIPVLVNRSIHDVSSISTWGIEPERSIDLIKLFSVQFTITIGIQCIKYLPHCLY